METWKPIPGHDGYEASDLGRVRSVDREIPGVFKGTAAVRLWRGRVLKLQRLSTGYLLVHLGKGNQRLVHRLVMLAFMGNPPPGQTVAHNDGNRSNNHLRNLRYDTVAGNNADKVRHGTHHRGERQGASKLTRKEVLAIRRSKAMGVTLASIYGVSQTQISAIRNRNSWSWL